jgi:hypothetical protein
VLFNQVTMATNFMSHARACHVRHHVPRGHPREAVPRCC